MKRPGATFKKRVSQIFGKIGSIFKGKNKPVATDKSGHSYYYRRFPGQPGCFGQSAGEKAYRASLR